MAIFKSIQDHKRWTGILFVLMTTLCFSQNPKVYTGLLHAHTAFSDGSGTPEEAFKMAQKSGLDFFAVTEHNHAEAEQGAKERTDGILISNNHALYNGTGKISITPKNGTKISVKSLISAAGEAKTSDFLPIYGQEFSTISSGNHMNVLGINEVLEIENGSFDDLIDLVAKLKKEGKAVPVLQLNHPDVAADLFYSGTPAKKQKNDYGLDDYDQDFHKLIEQTDEFVSLIEVLSGPAMKKKPIPNYRYEDTHENDYFFYLVQGFHISPSVGHDNHYKTWGSMVDSRMGVIAEALTQESVFEGFRNNRTYATEDKNLKVYYKINDKLMGSSIKAKAGSDLKISIDINDLDDAGADYEVEIYSALINTQSADKAGNVKAKSGLIAKASIQGNGSHAIKDIVASEEASFIYFKLTQENGSRTWTAPVWINETGKKALETENTLVPAESKYFWTKNPSSKVYHVEGCTLIETISEENLLQAAEPPTGRLQHNCSFAEEP